MLWFTSDLHLRHENILHYSHRPFPTVGEMGRTIIANINDRVMPGDTLWVLGDVCMGREKIQGCASFVSQLSCQDVRLVMGNHDAKDKDAMRDAGFAQVEDLVEIGVGGKGKAVLCHYPLYGWNRMGHGSLMLHGHIHSIGSEYNVGNRQQGLKRYDVGVDANGFCPVSIDQIKAFFDGVVPMDHHSLASGKGH